MLVHWCDLVDSLVDFVQWRYLATLEDAFDDCGLRRCYATTFRAGAILGEKHHFLLLFLLLRQVLLLVQSRRM